MSVQVCVCVSESACVCVRLSQSRCCVTVAKYAKTVNLYSILQKGHITNPSEWAGDRSITLSIATHFLQHTAHSPLPAQHFLQSEQRANPKLDNTAATDQANWHSAFENWSPEHPCADRKCANAMATLQRCHPASLSLTVSVIYLRDCVCACFSSVCLVVAYEYMFCIAHWKRSEWKFSIRWVFIESYLFFLNFTYSMLGEYEQKWIHICNGTTLESII